MREDLRFFSKSSKAPIFIHLAGVTYPDAFYHIERPNSTVTVIEYVTDGLGYVYENGKAVKVEKDSIYMIPKGEDHRYYADRESPYTKIFLNVGGSLCNDILSSYNLMGKHFF